uniref:Uncharacterized protein n=1 Tax=Arundo donax TaxID=35708 RepID=A0A0A9BBA3_ARUDO
MSLDTNCILLNVDLCSIVVLFNCTIIYNS